MRLKQLFFKKFFENYKALTNQTLLPVYQEKKKESQKVLFPKDNKWPCWLFFSQYPFYAKRQTGNLWIPICHLLLENTMFCSNWSIKTERGFNRNSSLNMLQNLLFLLKKLQKSSKTGVSALRAPFASGGWGPLPSAVASDSGYIFVHCMFPIMNTWDATRICAMRLQKYKHWSLHYRPSKQNNFSSIIFSSPPPPPKMGWLRVCNNYF